MKPTTEKITKPANILVLELTEHTIKASLKPKKKKTTLVVGHVAHMGEVRNEYKIWLENLKGRDHLEDPGLDKKIILKWILGKQGENV